MVTVCFKNVRISDVFIIKQNTNEIGRNFVRGNYGRLKFFQSTKNENN